MKIAIIGAGISGLTAGQKFSKNGHKVTIFEKARGVGGRMSTRRTDDFTFDHGAQCFTARTKPFQAFVREYEHRGIIKEWKGKVVSIEKGKKLEKRLWFETHFVACPNMNSLCKELAKSLDVNIQTEVANISKKAGLWSLESKSGDDLGDYDWVISTAPPAQTCSLMPDNFCYKEEVSKIDMHACFALMLGFKEKIETNWIAAKIRESKLKWVTINSKRPDRNGDITSIQIHSKDSWANDNVDKNIDEVQSEMIEEFKELTGINGFQADYASTHRWLYSLVKNTSKVTSYVDLQNKLAACGDWCLTSRIEESWISANDAVDKILEVK